MENIRREKTNEQTNMKHTPQHHNHHGNGVAGKGTTVDGECHTTTDQKNKEIGDGARSEASSHRPWGRSFRHQICFWYATILSKYPTVLCLLMFLAVVACGAASFVFYDIPNFDDPIAGFEPRGTSISKRTRTWNNMMNQTGSDLPLSPFPVTLPSYNPDKPGNLIVDIDTTTGPSSSATPDTGYQVGEEYSSSAAEEMYEENFDDYRNSESVDVPVQPSHFFCGNPKPMYARLVMEPIDKNDGLFTVAGLHSICRLEDDYIRRHIEFLRDCYTNEITGRCCPSWSLANYVAILNNKTSCMDIDETDITGTIDLLHKCSHFYRSRELPPNCTVDASNPNCQRLPQQCTQYDAVFSILHYIVDVNFMSIEKPLNEKVQHAVTFIPMYAGNDMREIYDDNFDNQSVPRNDAAKITGLYFNLKYDIFGEYLTMEIYLPILGISLVILLMWIYVGSLFITVMTILSMIMSLIFAYFIYRVILRISFFPFMNLTTVILLVGIGADDAFVYTDLWKRTRKDHPSQPLILVVMQTLRHAAVSMFVTSFTTSSAFFANAISSITSIKCFGIFAGTAILINFFFTITWLPAVVVIYERYFARVLTLGKEKRESRTYLYKKKTFCDLFVDCLLKIQYTISEWSRIFFDKILPCIVVKLRFIWLLTMGTLMFGGFCLIFLDPKLQLPTLPEFQLFESMNPFERYDFVYKDLFWFEKEKSGSLYAHMPITVVWGIKDTDNGDHLNPEDKGSLVYDENFNIANPDSQLWLMHFCSSLRNQSFYFPTPALQVEACFIETFKKWMESRECEDSTGADLSPCCKQTSFPYPASVFKTCLKTGISQLYNEFPTYFQKWKPGPRFSSADNNVVAAIVEFDSTYTFSYSYDEIYEFVSDVQSWINKELKSAPHGMQGAWFTSYLEFYDLQDNLARGTPIALGLAIIIATCVMFLTTQNLLISLYAILSISGTICVTIGALVLMGWQLNILESVILSVAVGLSIDFTVHYGVAYRIAPDTDRESRVVFSLARMGSAISMAALTTFIAGGLMLPSTILSYRQMGTFLMLIMVISWTYSTFFFQSLCRTIGPEGRTGQFPLPSCNCECTRIHAAKVAEDSDGSNSFHSSTVPSSGESHELEPLNAYSNSDYSSSGLGSSIGKSPARCRECKNNHVQPKKTTTTTSLDHFLAVPVTKQSSSTSSMEVVLEGEEFVTKVRSPTKTTKVPEDLIINVTVEPEPVVIPNNNPDIPDIWFPLGVEV